MRNRKPKSEKVEAPNKGRENFSKFIREPKAKVKREDDRLEDEKPRPKRFTNDSRGTSSRDDRSSRYGNQGDRNTRDRFDSNKDQKRSARTSAFDKNRELRGERSKRPTTEGTRELRRDTKTNTFDKNRELRGDRSKRPTIEDGTREFRRDPKKSRFDNNKEIKEERPKRLTIEGRAKELKREFVKKEAESSEYRVRIPEYNFKKLKAIESSKHTKKQANTKIEDRVTIPVEEQTTRLNKYIANAGVCSRREADKLILSGEIKVNGKVVIEMGYKVQHTDKVELGRKLLSREKKVYVLLNKPKDFITTTNDPEDRKTVMQLVSKACNERIYPIGRLDRQTTGLLLLTNDGELSSKLAHPSNNIKKIYHVGLDKPVDPEDIEKIVQGVTLEDGLAPVDDVGVISNDGTEVGIEIHIGRNRIVRRIFEHLGYDVIKLDRVTYAGLTKKDLPRGKWRYLSEKELIGLKYFK